MNNFCFYDQISCRAGKVINGRLEALFNTDDNLTDTIIRARVLNRHPGLGYFVDIGDARTALLKEQKTFGKISEGDSALVQVLHNGKGNKGAQVTMDLTLPGKFIVLTPFHQQIGFSKKLEIDEKNKLREFGKALFQHHSIGFFFRTSAAKASEEAMIEEFNTLNRLAHYLKKEKNFLPTPKTLWKPRKSMIEFLEKDELPIITNDDSLMEILTTYEDIRYDSAFRDIYHPIISKEIAHLTQRILPLKGGGELVFDTLEALTVIDVNSGNAENKSFQALAKSVNEQALDEVARQIRLRNLDGIILIDFLRENKARRNELMLSLMENFSADRRQVKVYGFTRTGLLEMIREKS